MPARDWIFLNDFSSLWKALNFPFLSFFWPSPESSEVSITVKKCNTQFWVSTQCDVTKVSRPPTVTETENEKSLSKKVPLKEIAMSCITPLAGHNGATRHYRKWENEQTEEFTRPRRDRMDEITISNLMTSIGISTVSVCLSRCARAKKVRNFTAKWCNLKN